MKKLLALLIIASFPAISMAQHNEAQKGIQFQHVTWAEALAKAKQENKLIFMDAFTTWCGPCKYLAKNTFTNDTVGEFFNKNFICIKMDMEKGEGIGLAKTYGVQAYPTLLYIDGNGEVIHRTCGADMSPSGTKSLLNAGKDAIDPDKQFASIKKKYDSGKPDAATAYAYMKMRADGCMESDAEVKKYFQDVPEKEIPSRPNWNIIYHFLNDADSRAFRLMLANKEEFYKLYTADSVNSKILSVYEESLSNAIKSDSLKLYEDLKTELEAAKIPGSKKTTLLSDMFLYEEKGDKDKYAATAVLYVNGYAKDDANMLNSIAWRFYENIDNPKMLQNAVGWSKRSTELDNSYANNDTYAALLYKTGKKDEAMKAAEKAIDIAKKNNEDHKETDELLQKIKAMK